MRRRAPELLVGLLLVALLASYVVFTHRVVSDLQGEARRSSEMFATVFRARNDTSESAGILALNDLVKQIREQGVPVIVTDAMGNPTTSANLPEGIEEDSVQLRSYVRELDRQNAPVLDPLIGGIHFGNTPLVRWLKIIPALQATSALILLLAAIYIVRTRGNAERERVWAGMARESAHQLGTPLSSLSGWVELMEDRATDESTLAAVANMRADLLRLDRVAHRFERIGREPRRDSVDVVALVDRIATYFRARVPKLSNAVSVEVEAADHPVVIAGDSVLLEWAMEVLVKNAVDALAGRGGSITLSTTERPEGGARIIVSDDGPGVPREIRGHIFDPGFSTKKSGWGIGLSLARRIVEENHRGTIRLLPTDRGATFEIILV